MLNECTSAFKKIGDTRLIVKNRDKHYAPRISVNHEVRNGTEILYYVDEDSLGVDGINEHGIGIVFNSINFKSDDAENASKNAGRVITALTKSDLREIIYDLVSDSGFKGLMIITTPKMTVLVENDPDTGKKARLKKLIGKNWDVVTNMPQMLSWKHDEPERDAEGYLSCVVRKALAEVELRDAKDIDTALRSLAYRYFSDESHLNPYRDSEYSTTHMQVGIDASKKQLVLSKIPDKLAKLSVKNKVPDGHEAKCKLVLRQFVEPVESPFRMYTTNIEEGIDKFNLVNYLEDGGEEKNIDVLSKKQKHDIEKNSSMKLAQRAAEQLWEKERLLISIIRKMKKDPVFFTAGYSSKQVEKEIRTLERMLEKMGDDYEKLLNIIHQERYGSPMEMLEVKNEAANRKPRKKGQKKKSSKHSDLYTDEDPKGTIHGLGFKDAATARSGVAKVNKAKRKHAHKVQATLVMKQRGKVAIDRTKDPEKKKNLKAANEIWSDHLEKLKAKTKAKNESLLSRYISEVYRSATEESLVEGSRIVPAGMTMSEWESYKKRHKTTAKAYNEKASTKWKITHGPGHKNAGKTIKGNTGLTYKKAKSIQNAFGGW